MSAREDITAGISALLDAQVKATYTTSSPRCTRIPKQPADLQPEQTPWLFVESVSERAQDAGNGLQQGLLRLNVWGHMVGPFAAPDTTLNALLRYLQEWLLRPSPLTLTVGTTRYPVSVTTPEPNESFYSDEDAIVKYPIEVEYYWAF